MIIDSLDINYFDFEKNEFGSLELDAYTEQKITLNSLVSKDALETGEVLADAIVNQPMQITVKGLISDLAQNYKEELEMIAEAVTAVFTSKALTASKSVKGWQKLYKLWEDKQLISITSPINGEDTFKDLAIESIEVEVTSLKALQFTAKLTQVLISSNIKKPTLSSEVGNQSVRG